MAELFVWLSSSIVQHSDLILVVVYIGALDEGMVRYKRVILTTTFMTGFRTLPTRDSLKHFLAHTLKHHLH